MMVDITRNIFIIKYSYFSFLNKIKSQLEAQTSKLTFTYLAVQAKGKPYSPASCSNWVRFPTPPLVWEASMKAQTFIEAITTQPKPRNHPKLLYASVV